MVSGMTPYWRLEFITLVISGSNVEEHLLVNDVGRGSKGDVDEDDDMISCKTSSSEILLNWFIEVWQFSSSSTERV